MTAELLDCGHEVSPHTEHTTGYGVDKDGRKLCYDCCARGDREYMAREGKITAYLSDDGKRITTWSGNPLMTVSRESIGSAGGFARSAKITRVWAVDEQGNWWHGRGPGRGMYIRMRRSVAKRRTA